MAPLPLLCLLALSGVTVWCHDPLTREQLTEEVEKLADRLDKMEDQGQLADDIGKLGDKLKEAVETMGQTMGQTLQNLTEGIETMGERLSEGVEKNGDKLMEGVEKMGDKLTEGVEKMGDKLTEGVEKIGETLANRNNESSSESSRPASCVDVRKYDKTNGVHILTVNNRDITVFCDQTTAGGGWTVIQRRRDGSVDFYRGWNEYTRGFGDLNGEFWLGLDNIHLLTSSFRQTLRVDLHDFSGNTAYAEYKNFYISGPDNYYRLYVDGYSDSMAHQNHQRFSTKDRDHDAWSRHCAVEYQGAWWYNACYHSNLNGRYLGSSQENTISVNWYKWKGNRHIALKHVEMKIRPAWY